MKASFVVFRVSWSVQSPDSPQLDQLIEVMTVQKPSQSSAPYTARQEHAKESLISSVDFPAAPERGLLSRISEVHSWSSSNRRNVVLMET